MSHKRALYALFDQLSYKHAHIRLSRAQTLTGRSDSGCHRSATGV